MANDADFNDLWMELSERLDPTDDVQLEGWALRVRERAQELGLMLVPERIVIAFSLLVGPYMPHVRAVALLAL